jgi:hypothetical protein
MPLFRVNRPHRASLLTFLLLAAVRSPARGDFITLDFEELRSQDNQIHNIGAVYTRNGFTLTATHFAPNNTPDFNYVGTLNENFTGSTALFHHISQGQITLTRADSGLFNLLSIDLSELPAHDTQGNPIDYGPFSVTFTGVRPNLSTVMQTVPVKSFPVVTTDALTGFTGLVSVYWFQGAGGAPGLQTHQFDNIVLEAAAVPEPSGFVLLCSGIFVLLVHRTAKKLGPG